MHSTADLVAELAALRPGPALSSATTRIALRELGRRAEFLDSQIERLDDPIGPLVTDFAPGLIALQPADREAPAPAHRRGWSASSW
jgi:hypothetical protein